MILLYLSVLQKVGNYLSEQVICAYNFYSLYPFFWWLIHRHVFNGQSSDSSRLLGLNLFLQLLKESISNRALCVKAGMLNFLIDWFSQEEDDGVVLKLAQLIQVTGGHSISGKDIRKIFALLRSEKVGTRQQYCSLLLTSILSMMNEKGPTAFFDLNGNSSVSLMLLATSLKNHYSLILGNTHIFYWCVCVS